MLVQISIIIEDYAVILEMKKTHISYSVTMTLFNSIILMVESEHAWNIESLKDPWQQYSVHLWC